MEGLADQRRNEFYEEPPPITRDRAETAIASSSADEAGHALISVALHERDPTWAENFCLRGLQDPREEVLAAAITGLGHFARLHRKVSPKVIQALGEFHGDAVVGGLVEDALDDIKIFAGVPH